MYSWNLRYDDGDIIDKHIDGDGQQDDTEKFSEDHHDEGAEYLYEIDLIKHGSRGNGNVNRNV